MPGKPLTPEAILDAAEALLEREGPDALTMRRLASEMGRSAMAFYNHFPDREAIIAGLVDRLYRSVPPPARRGDWKSRIRAVCRVLVAGARAKPNLARLAMTRPTKPLSAKPLQDYMFDALAEAGLDARQQAAAYGTLGVFLRGYLVVQVEAQDASADPKDSRRVLDAGIDLLCTGIEAAAKESSAG